MREEEFRFGVKGGKLVHVDEVVSGLNCGCVCPACGSKYVAYKGKKLSHHFKHHAVPNCKYALETSLHLMAKEIIDEEGYLLVPDYHFLPATLQNMFQQGFAYTVDMKRLKFDSIQVEKPIDNFRPDLICKIGNKKLILEVTVTHKIEEPKLAHIKNLNLPLLEINLSDCYRYITKEQLKHEIYQSPKRILWRNNPKLENRKNNIKIAREYTDRFAKANSKELKLYGNNKEVKHCPILHHQPSGNINFFDNCNSCPYLLSYYEWEHEDGSDAGTSIQCIGHKALELDNLLQRINSSASFATYHPCL